MKKFIADQCKTLLQLASTLDWLAPLAIRLLFGYFWLETGWAKLHNLDGFTERFIGWGIPFPAFSATLSAATEFIGGVLILIGLFTRLVSIPMIANMIVAIAVVAIKPVTSLDEFVEIDEPLYTLVFFWLLIAGPGKISLDALIAKWLGISTAKKIA